MINTFDCISSVEFINDIKRGLETGVYNEYILSVAF